jgi:hypothetical protein
MKKRNYQKIVDSERMYWNLKIACIVKLRLVWVIPWLKFSLICNPEDFISTSPATNASLLIVYIRDMVAVHFNLILLPILKCFISKI